MVLRHMGQVAASSAILSSKTEFDVSYDSNLKKMQENNDIDDKNKITSM